jgi:NADH-quinone oxidoreductase subunit J
MTVPMDQIFFYLFATVTVVASVLVIGQRNPMYSVLLLIASFGGLAGLYVLLDAPFVAVTQIIVYAGAIMVLFLFVVMLLNVPREEAPPPGLFGGAIARRVGVVLAIALVFELVWAIRRIGAQPFTPESGDAADSLTSVHALGQSLYTRHAFAFEATSILILVAMVGAVVIARKLPPGTRS